MIARVEDLSIFGAPPAPVTPKAPTESCTASRTHTINPVTDSTLQNAAEAQVVDDCDEDIGFFANNINNEDEDGEAAVEARARTAPIISNTPHRRSHPPASQGQYESRDPYTAHRSDLDQDEKNWKRWHEQVLPQAFSQLIPERQNACLQTTSTVSSLECQHLNYVFARDEYTRVRMSSERSPEHIIFVHDIRYDDGSDTRSYYLLVTKYSVLTLMYPFQAKRSSGYRDVAINDKELLLHFEDFNKMGMRDDAEIIQLNDIAYAEDLTSGFETTSDSVDHVVRPPQDLDNCGLYCRFGICTAANSGVACITPIASSLLRRQDRWRGRKFINTPGPLVFDLTPNVLGPSEGFSQAGFAVQAAMGFDQEHHVTWKIRHHPNQVYDCSPLDVFDEFKSGKLQPPPLPHPEPPKVALVAGENAYFRLNDGNKQMPSMEQFLHPLDIMDAAAESSLSPDFLVLMMPPALLHFSTIGRFSATMLKLLEQRLSVHMKLSPLQDHGLPQDRSVLIVVASPSCASLPWNFDWPIASPQPSIKINDIIGDLAFENPRATGGANSGFVCTRPLQYSADEGNRSVKYIYNHQTGHRAPPGEIPLEMDANTIFAPCNGPKPWVHPIRHDLLTVREIARIQGFLDDFVFYLSEISQYNDVWRALPPVVAQLVAKTVLHVIRASLVMKVDDPWEALRANKRVRLEDGEERA